MTSADFSLRVMEIGDYAAVSALWRATPGVGLNDLDDSRAGIARYLDRNPRTCFIAQIGGELAGAILAGHDGRRGIISHTCVSPKFRRMGIGRALAQAALDALGREGVTKVFLVVFKDDQPGNEFWRDMGFNIRSDLNYRDLRLIKI